MTGDRVAAERYRAQVRGCLLGGHPPTAEAFLLCSIAVTWHHGPMSATWHGYVGVQRRGLIALPSEVRRRLHLDEPGAQVEVTERPDGVLELRAALPVPADQAWFWTEQWQQREREVDEHVGAGRVTVHESTEDFLAHLDNVDDE